MNVMPAPSFDAKLFREAMSQIAATVFVVTTDGLAGRAGLTATAVTAVSDAPPTLLVCIRQGSLTGTIIQRNKQFCLNSLAAEDEAVARIFAGSNGASGADKFTPFEWLAMGKGVPMLKQARLAFECALVDKSDIATHSLYIGEVRSIHLADTHDETAGLGYVNRHYKAL
jgi:flavin reductase